MALLLCFTHWRLSLQEAANKELDTLKHINKPMYDAVTAMIAQSKELEQLAAGAQPQPQPAVQQQQQTQPHHQRRLMSTADSSNSGDDTLVEPFALGSSSAGSARHLMQAAGGQATAGQAAGGAPVVVGVEADPKHAGLTQEALDSFKVFEDVPADAASTAGNAGSAAGDAAGQAAGEGAAAVDAAGVDVAGGEQGADAALAQEQHHTRGTDYDEFGDAWNADLWKQTHGKGGG